MIKAALTLLVVSALSFGCAASGGAQDIKAGPAPDFKARLITGQEVTLAKFRGKPLVLNVGASWCPHCQHEMPALAKVYNEHRGEIEMLVVFVKSPTKDVNKLIKKHGLKAKVVVDPDAAAVAKAYDVTGIPATFFIDAKGNVVDDYFGSIEEDELTKRIDEITKKK